jgi:hypothetical protein
VQAIRWADRAKSVDTAHRRSEGDW